MGRANCNDTSAKQEKKVLFSYPGKLVSSETLQRRREEAREANDSILDYCLWEAQLHYENGFCWGAGTRTSHTGKGSDKTLWKWGVRHGWRDRVARQKDLEGRGFKLPSNPITWQNRKARKAAAMQAFDPMI